VCSADRAVAEIPLIPIAFGGKYGHKEVSMPERPGKSVDIIMLIVAIILSVAVVAIWSTGSGFW
jgi:hypothetical protein